MSLPRVLVVIGTRPEGIKLAPVIRALRQRASDVDTRVALTGQHNELLDQVLEVFRIQPDDDLEIMREGQDLYDVTTRCLTGLRDIVRRHQPDMILVEGDTASVFVAGLTAFYERRRVGHVEAGLRSRDKWRPWPEEIFRRLTGVVADLHFAPTTAARANLLAEGVPPDSVHVTGNTVVDALLAISAQPHPPDNAELREIVRLDNAWCWSRHTAANRSASRCARRSAASAGWPMPSMTCTSSTRCTPIRTSLPPPGKCWADTRASA